MHRIITYALILAVAAGVLLFVLPASETEDEISEVVPLEAGLQKPESAEPQLEEVKVIAEDLEIPWDVAFLPEGDLLVTERIGRLTKIASDGARAGIALDGVKHIGEGGLLGMALHPKFSENHFLYLYFTSAPESEGTKNRIERYRLEGNVLLEKKVILDGIPGAKYHDGGRLEFGPDGFLYITTGDATDEKLAQDKSSLAGKILRLKDDGAIPAENPFGTAVYSYGHRNPQGIAWDAEGRLWSTEHGRSGILSGLDEINLIRPGENYGWPEIQGEEIRAGMAAPALQSGADLTWAPASAGYLDGNIFFGGLRGESLYKATLDGERVIELRSYFHREFGRIRTVRVGPDGMLYLTTSNRDGRGTPKPGDDKIIRVDPKTLSK